MTDTLLVGATTTTKQPGNNTNKQRQRIRAMQLTVADLRETLDRLLREEAITDDYLVGFMHAPESAQREGYAQIFPIDAQHIFCVDEYPDAPKMVVLMRASEKAK
jgi:hypothetical protein